MFTAVGLPFGHLTLRIQLNFAVGCKHNTSAYNTSIYRTERPQVKLSWIQQQSVVLSVVFAVGSINGVEEWIHCRCVSSTARPLESTQLCCQVNTSNAVDSLHTFKQWRYSPTWQTALVVFPQELVFLFQSRRVSSMRCVNTTKHAVNRTPTLEQ